ncbi:M48 family metalloprotease [Arenibacterium sp. CAU 1754]
MPISHCAVMVFDRLSRLASMLACAPAAGLAVALYLVSTVSAGAVTLLRDADIEHGLNQLSAPILRAAGLSPQRVRVLIIDDSSLNAFVVNNQTILIHYGLIQKVASAEALQAVIAHEAAHISNGHIARRMGNLGSARTAAGLGAALAVLAAAAGAGEAAGGIAIGTASSAQRSFLAHSRAEEAAADRSAASYLQSSGVSPRGLVELHETFRGQEVLSVSRRDPYTRSHPLTRDRIRAAQAYLASYGDTSTENPTADYWFARIRGKLTAFKQAPKWTLRRIKEERFKDVRLMREAVAYHRRNDLTRAIAAIDGAMAVQPRDAFYYDLKAQLLIENRKTAQAVSAYKTAVSLAPSDALILAGYGRALLAAGQPKAALTQLEKARARDFRDARLLRDLSVAYAKTGQPGMAAMVTAERYAIQGRLDDAGIHAKRATGLLPRGSAAWQRAQDVLIAYEQNAKRKKR